MRTRSKPSRSAPAKIVPPRSLRGTAIVVPPDDPRFAEFVALIDAARRRRRACCHALAPLPRRAEHEESGGQGFAIDLLFFHRGLACLVAFELKVRKFQPEDLGKLSFYAEALDRDVKKPHERPTIGVLLCATKDDEVVEYALARTSSPTLVAEYETMLPSKELLRRKLHELYARIAPDDAADDETRDPCWRSRTRAR